LQPWFILPWSLALLEPLASLLPYRPGGRRFDFPRFPDPSNDILRASPMVRRAVRSRLGSALGLSQPLSGFLAHPNSAALFRAAAVPGILPSELSPRRDRAPLSRPLGSLAVIHRRAWVYRSCALSPLVSPTPTLSRSRLAPPAAMGALSTNRSPLPGCPGLQAAESPDSASFTCFEASIPLRIRSHPAQVAPFWRSMLSWVCSPLESSPTTPCVLDPPRPRGPEHAPSSEDSGSRPKGPCNPSSRVRPA